MLKTYFTNIKYQDKSLESEDKESQSKYRCIMSRERNLVSQQGYKNCKCHTKESIVQCFQVVHDRSDSFSGSICAAKKSCLFLGLPFGLLFGAQRRIQDEESIVSLEFSLFLALPKKQDNVCDQPILSKENKFNTTHNLFLSVNFGVTMDNDLIADTKVNTLTCKILHLKSIPQS